MEQQKTARRGAIFRYAPLAVLLVLFALNLAYKFGLAFSWAPELGGFERNVIWGVQQIMKGKPLYTNPESLPFAVIQYMPFYYHLVAFLAKIFQIDPQKVHSLYVCGRLFSLLLSLGSVALVFVLATRRFRVGRLTALAVCFFIFCLMEKFSVAARPDALKAFCFLSASCFFIWRGPLSAQSVGFHALGFLFALGAFMSKQDGLVALGVLPLTLLLFGHTRSFLFYGLLATAALAILIFSLQYVYDKQFLANVAGGLQNGISISWFIGSFNGYFSALAVVFGLAMVLAYEFFRESDWSLRVLASAWFCSFFPALFFSLKYGSGPNYFFEATLIAGLFLAIWLDKVRFSALFVRKESYAAFLSVAAGLYFLIPALNWSTSIFLNQETELKSGYLAQEKAVKLAENKLPGSGKILVLTQKQWLEYYTCLLSEKVACPQRDVSIQMFDAGKTDQARALQFALDQGQIQAILADKNSSPSFLNLDFSAFEKKDEIGDLSLWLQKSYTAHP